MKKVFLFSLLLLLHLPDIYAQKEAWNWYFGYNAGITFNGCCPTPLLDGKMQTDEGSATISDKYGNLLFYTDGSIVFNRLHKPMINGENLFGAWCSKQSALIVPLPGDTNIYYIFTADCHQFSIGEYGYNYSIVDMRLDGGFGDVTMKNAFLYRPSSEKLIAVRHSNKKDAWIITHEVSSNCFRTFLFTSKGLDTTSVISCIGEPFQGGQNPTVNF